MYTRYFGFNEKPFTLTPNPRFLFLSKNHKEAFAHLLYGINNHYGFIELTGEVGTGKTTVLRTLLGQLQDESHPTALIFSPCLTGVELLRSINTEFGLDAKSEYANELLAELNRFLLSETAAGRTVVLVIDEAQNLEPDVLEQIRLISNLETENDKLIQIVLSGQPELETLLGRSDLRQLNQRIAVRYKLRSLSMDETRSYIRQRMEVAGETGGVSFSRAAVSLIHLCTRGVPRMVNILCDRALLVAYGDECRRVTVIIVVRAMWELMNRSQERRISLASVVVIALVFAVCLTMLSKGGMPANLFAQKPLATTSKVIAPAPLDVVPPRTSADKASPAAERLKQEILSFDQNDTHILAFNAIAERWRVRPIKVLNGGLDIPDTFRRIASYRGLRVTLFKGSLDEALRFDLPFVVVTGVSGVLGEYCYAVTSANNGLFAVSPALLDTQSMPGSDLESISNGTFYLVWQNFYHIPDSISPGERRIEVHKLQQLLKQAGFYHDQINGTYGSKTVEAVRAFQRSLGIDGNDSLGEVTLAALTRFDSRHTIPSLKEN